MWPEHSDLLRRGRYTGLMEADPIIRRIRAGEGPVLRAIRLRALSSDPAAFETDLSTAQEYGDELWADRAAIASDGGEQVVFLAEIDRRVEAMVGAYVRDGETFATLYGMWVAPELRGSGVAETLVTAIETWSASTGLDRVQLCYFDNNSVAERLYARLGYRPTESEVIGRSCGRELHVSKSVSARP
jgi:GNAT superfamily N-acetyltransferase